MGPRVAALVTAPDPTPPAGDITKTPKGVMIGMRAAGLSLHDIGDAAQADWRTVRAVTSTPAARRSIQEYRERLKRIKIRRAYRLEPKLWARLDKEVTSGEARDVDALMRAALASEKIQAAAAGEGARVEVTNLTPAVDIKVLINQLLAENPTP